jgi:ribokinase
MKRILVAGSLNIDFVVKIPKLPIPGETVLGDDCKMLAGGKGANQANAAGKLGARVGMAGCLGADIFSQELRRSLSAAGVDTSLLQDKPDVSTGIALVPVEDSGQNTCIVASGANGRFSVADAEALQPAIQASSFLLMQLETPLPTVERLAQLARQADCVTVLDPAPAQRLSSQLLSLIDIVTPNEFEAQMLLGLPPARLDPNDAPAMATRIHALGARSVVLKLGEHGCYFSSGSESGFVKGFSVTAIDTTAAGDTFNAALAVALAEDQPWPQALRFANAAAAISVTRLGAQTSAPTRAEVTTLLDSQ